MEVIKKYCDICASDENVSSYTVPTYHIVDGELLGLHKDTVDMCDFCAIKSTLIHSMGNNKFELKSPKQIRNTK